MSINALNEKIEKQLEKLNQLKAQKQAIEAREKNINRFYDAKKNEQ